MQKILRENVNQAMDIWLFQCQNLTEPENHPQTAFTSIAAA